AEPPRPCTPPAPCSTAPGRAVCITRYPCYYRFHERHAPKNLPCPAVRQSHHGADVAVRAVPHGAVRRPPAVVVGVRALTEVMTDREDQTMTTLTEPRTLRGYQHEAVNAVVSAWGRDTRRVGVVAATGLGKSTIIA